MPADPQLRALRNRPPTAGQAALAFAALVALSVAVTRAVWAGPSAHGADSTPLDLLSPRAYLPLVVRTWPCPLYVGLHARWDGEGYVRTEVSYDVGLHLQRDAVEKVGADTIRIYTQEWFDPNPQGWAPVTGNEYYAVSTGERLPSSVPGDPAWKWSQPWILPYAWSFADGEVVSIDGQSFRVSGPHAGQTAFGQEVQYWELANTAAFVFWDDGGEWQQLVDPGDIVLRYDAGPTRLLLHRDVLRRYAYQGEPTAYTVHYVYDLTETNAFAPAGALRAPFTEATKAVMPVPDDTIAPRRSPAQAGPLDR